MKYSFIKKIIDSTIILLLIFSSGGLLFVFNRNTCYLIFLGLLVFSFIFIGKSLKSSVINAALLTLFSIVILFSINYFYAITEQSINKYFYYITVSLVSIFTLTYFINNRSYEELVKTIYFVLKLLVFHSLINFIVYFIFKNNLTTISSVNNDYETFSNLFFYMIKEKNVIDVFGIEFCRNMGVFWEPGVLQVFLNLFFFLEAFVFKQSKTLLFITAFVILTTYSTTGIAILLIQGLVYIYNVGRVNRLLIPVLFIFLLPVFIVFNINFDEKRIGVKSFSFQKRIFDLTQPFFIAIENPLTGIGLDIEKFINFRQEFYFSSTVLTSLQDQVGVQATTVGTDKGSSNSVMFLLAGTGFPTTILLLYMFFRQQMIKEKKWLLMTILLISVMSEPLLLRPFFFIFIVSGFFHIFHKITSHKTQIE